MDTIPITDRPLFTAQHLRVKGRGEVKGRDSKRLSNQSVKGTTGKAAGDKKNNNAGEGGGWGAAGQPTA